MPAIPSTYVIARTADEINEARNRAQQVSFAAEDDPEQEGDEVADAVYQTLQWVLGDADVDPTVEMAELADASDDDEDDPDDE
jgi:hypothetical protein